VRREGGGSRPPLHRTAPSGPPPGPGPLDDLRLLLLQPEARAVCLGGRGALKNAKKGKLETRGPRFSNAEGIRSPLDSRGGVCPSSGAEKPPLGSGKGVAVVNRFGTGSIGSAANPEFRARCGIRGGLGASCKPHTAFLKPLLPCSRSITEPPKPATEIAIYFPSLPYHGLGSGFWWFIQGTNSEVAVFALRCFLALFSRFSRCMSVAPPSPLRELQEEARGQERKRRQASEVGEVDRQLDRWQEEYARGGRRTAGGGRGIGRQPEVNIAAPPLVVKIKGIADFLPRLL